jgi:competence protein ComEC
MKRPLLPVALLYVGGVLCGQCARPSLLVLFIASFAVAAAALAWTRLRLPLLCVLLVLTGWTNATWREAIVSSADLRVVAGGQAAAARLRGSIEAPPTQRIFTRGQREQWSSAALIRVNSISTNNEWRPAFGTVIATAPEILPASFFEGQSVEVSGVLQVPRGPLAEGLFDPRTFYGREGVYYQLRTGGTHDWSVSANGARVTLPVSERFRRWATKTLALGLPYEDEPQRLSRTLLLDWKAPLSAAVEDPFMRAGTYHIFAVDGLRIGLLAGICLGLLRVLRVPRAWRGAMVLPVLWFYTGLTGWPASAVRATIMASVVIMGWVLKRPGDGVNSLCAAALIILLWEPRQLFQAGFQLSFLVVLCIVLMVPRLHEALWDRFFKGDPFLPDTLQTRWPAMFYQPARWMADIFAVSLAAWVGSIPLAACYFHLFTPASVPANCVVVPATALALMSGLGSLAAGAWLPGLAGLLNNSTWALLKFISWFSGCAAHWPGGNFNAAAPAFSTIVFYYAALLLVVTGWIFRSKFRRPALAAIGAAGLCLMAHWAIASRAARIDVLPLNGAAAIYVKSPGWGNNLLLDCGDAASAERVLKPFLCAQGVNRLPAFCLAVGLQNHVGGAEIVRSNFSAGRIYTAPAPARSVAYRGLLDELASRSRCQMLHEGDEVAGWQVLHPAGTNQFAQADDNACALWREFNGHSILLLPALGRAGQDALVGRRPELRAEIVVAGLPARDEPLSEPLLELLRPALIIIVDSEFPATRRASPKLRSRLERGPARVVYCRDTGALTLGVTPRGWSLRTADGGRAEPRRESSEQ